MTQNLSQKEFFKLSLEHLMEICPDVTQVDAIGAIRRIYKQKEDEQRRAEEARKRNLFAQTFPFLREVELKNWDINSQYWIRATSRDDIAHDTQGIYAIVAAGRCWYVGQSINIRKRLKSAGHPWKYAVANFSDSAIVYTIVNCEEIERRRIHLAIEEITICALSPEWNPSTKILKNWKIADGQHPKIAGGTEKRNIADLLSKGSLQFVKFNTGGAA